MASPSVRADDSVLGDFIGVAAIAPERDGGAEEFFAVAGPDFPEGEFIAGMETTDAFGASAAAREALARSEEGARRLREGPKRE
ncbi:MAG: hypothetical protein NTX09_13745 [Verrucomicrobia bacterium]|nr:hypothetical protein [Verrucomicrobiota bacterium]